MTPGGRAELQSQESEARTEVLAFLHPKWRSPMSYRSHWLSLIVAELALFYIGVKVELSVYNLFNPR